MQNQIQARLNQLKSEFEKGQAKLQDLQQQQTHLHETLLRIGGAIQVLTELLEKEAAESGNRDAAIKPVKNKS